MAAQALGGSGCTWEAVRVADRLFQYTAPTQLTDAADNFEEASCTERPVACLIAAEYS